MDGTVLVADDDRTIRTVLTQALTRAGCKVHATSSLMTLMRWVEEGKGDLVITDVIMPDGNGLETLPRISKLRPGLPVIVISAQNTIMTAIQAAEAEAYDYLPKPFDLPDLMKRSARALDIKRRTTTKPAAPREAGDDLPLVGRTVAMQALYRLVARVMNSDLSVLVTEPRPFLIAGDAINRASEPDEGFADASDPVAAAQSAARLMDLLRDNGATLIWGHEPSQWPLLPKAPTPLT